LHGGQGAARPPLNVAGRERAERRRRKRLHRHRRLVGGASVARILSAHEALEHDLRARQSQERASGGWCHHDRAGAGEIVERDGERRTLERFLAGFHARLERERLGAERRQRDDYGRHCRDPVHVVARLARRLAA